MIISFCGHSDYTESPKDEALVLEILQQTAGDGDVEFYLGEYGKFDYFAYRCAQKYRAINPNARLYFITPYINAQTNGNKKFDEIIYPPLENVPPKFAISHRNRWMVERSDVIIAYISHKFGGAYTTYKYAVSNNKKIFNLCHSFSD